MVCGCSGTRGQAVGDPVSGVWHTLRHRPDSGEDWSELLPSADGHRWIAVGPDGTVAVVDPYAPDGSDDRVIARSRLTPRDQLVHLLSPTGHALAVADPSTARLELVDLRAADRGAPARASVTLDGTLLKATWVADAGVAVVGSAGVQFLTLVHPDPARSAAGP